MTTLPSFEELMTTLGLDPSTRTSKQSSPQSSPSPPPKFLSVPSSSPTRSKSSPSLRDQAIARNKGARYSPYTPNFQSFQRRGSLSSTCSSSPELETRSLRAPSSSPRPPPSPRYRRRSSNKLTVNLFDSSTDLSANTPISSFVRRKTPGASPTSPSFPRERRFDSPAASPMPFTLPTLPPLFPQSPAPLTPDSDEHWSSEPDSPRLENPRLSDAHDVGVVTHRSRYHTGIRISTPPSSAGLKGKHPRRRVVHVA